MATIYGSAERLQARMKGPYGSVAIRAVEVSLAADGWKGAVSPFSQAVTVPGITAASRVDLQPGAELLEQMRLAGMGLAAENDGGQVTVYAFGGCPKENVTVQATVTEVQK